MCIGYMQILAILHKGLKEPQILISVGVLGSTPLTTAWDDGI